MRKSAPPSGPTYDPEAAVTELSAQTARMIAVAQALVSTRRRIDVEGLQHHVGLLCAKALDLPPSRTGLLRFELRQLASSLDRLTASLRANAA